MTNHFVIEGGGGWRERLGEMNAPTLVVHGTEDPLFPYGHALALAKEIPGARLLAMEQTGHELPRAVWDVCRPAHPAAHMSFTARWVSGCPKSRSRPGAQLGVTPQRIAIYAMTRKLVD